MSEVLPLLLRAIAIVILFMIIGFGPGYILGVLIANRTTASNLPHRIDKHEEDIRKAEEHNKQWNPEDPRWQK